MRQFLLTGLLLLQLMVWSVCVAQDATSTLPLRDARLADDSLVYMMLNRHFYQPDKIKVLKGQSAEDTLQYLVDSELDRWASFELRDALDEKGNTVFRDDYGLRLIDHNGSFYLLPEIAGPNEVDDFTLYRVLEVPENGWQDALASNTLLLAPPHAATRFVKEQYIASAFKLQDSVLRLDNFINPILASDIERYSKDLSTVSTLDLRFNGGGRVDLAAELLLSMLGESASLGHSTARGKIISYGETGNDIERDRFAELTVLVSRHTASAAEWAARILQFYGAQIVGERTEGKCLIHNTYPVGNRVYFSFASGELKTEIDFGYDYCGNGLVPDLFAYDLPLISLDARHLTSLARRCVSPELENTAKNTAIESCQKLFPGFANLNANTNTEANKSSIHEKK